MEKRKVWKIIKKDQVPKDRRCVKSRWVWKIKRNGVFRARLVACGYSQISGIDFTESFAPVIHDTSYRIMMTCAIIWKLQQCIIDITTAFLHGDLEEEIYMHCPSGVQHEEDECLQLQKTIYGLVQSARQFYKKTVQVFKSPPLNFKGGYADPCLLSRRSEKGLVLLALYVDDCYCVGHKEAIEETIQLIERHTEFDIKTDFTMTDYLSCELNLSKDGTKGVLRQPHLLKNLEKKFGDVVKSLKQYRTPGTPGMGMMKPTPNMIRLSPADHATYRSGVGMLLYLVKHSRPDIANAVRELTKVLDCPTLIAMKEMKRIIKFVLDTKTFGLKIHPRKPKDECWDMICYTDSDFAGDKESRISVSGYILFLLGVPICWRSKGQKSVTLSSSEAEFVALSEAAKRLSLWYKC